MEAIVSSYLSKKLPSSGSKKSLSDSLETANRVQGLLSDDIVFEKTGPQSDPWLKTMESLQTAECVNDHTKNGSAEKNTLGFFGGLQQKGQKRFSDQDAAGPQVILRNSGSRAQVGLTNVGNTCYFNSMLQCLTNCKPFYNYIRSEAHDKNVCRRGDNCVLCLLKVFSVNNLPLNPTQKVINGTVLRDLLVKMRTAVRRWKIHAQQSADEILSYVMDSMWEREMQYYALKQNQTPMFNIFGTVIEQQYACSLCGKASIVKMVEPTIILGLVNGDRRSVQDRLRVEYGLAETLSEPKDKCNGCGRVRTPRPTMKRVLKDLPMVLVIMLKRFYVIDGISHKINQFVQFPETLDLRPCMDPMSKSQNSLYKLTGVVEHWGKSVTDGHYVAYCKNYCNLRKTEGWFYLNDTLVRPIDLKSVLQKHAYLLFYTAQNQTIRTVKLPSKITNGIPQVSPQAIAPQAKIRKTCSEGSTSGLPSPSPSPSTSKCHSNGVCKVASKKPDLEPPKYDPLAADQPGVSGYSNGLKGQDGKLKVELSNGKGSEAAKGPTVSTLTLNPAPPAVASLSLSTLSSSPSSLPAAGTVADAAGGTTVAAAADDVDGAKSQSHKEGTVRSKSYSLLVDCNGNSHRKHGDKSGKKSIFTNLGSKLILLKNLPPDQTEVQKSLVPYESSDDDEDDDAGVEEVASNKIEPAPNAPLNGSRFSSSLTWVIDKFNDAPSVTSNSSQNSSVHGTSPGWKVCSTDASRASSPHCSASPAVQAGVNRTMATAHRSQKEKVSTVLYCPKVPAALQKEAFRKKEEQRSKGHVLQGPAAAIAVAAAAATTAAAAGSSSVAMAATPTPAPASRSFEARSFSQPVPFGGEKSSAEKTSASSEQRSHVEKPSTSDQRRYSAVNSEANSQMSELAKNGTANGCSYWGAWIDSSKVRTEREEYDDELDQGRQKKVKHRHAWKGGDRRAENPFQREQDMRYKTHGGGSIMHRKSFKDLKHSSRFKSHFPKWGNNSNNSHTHNGNHRQNSKQHWRFNSKSTYGKNQGYKR